MGKWHAIISTSSRLFRSVSEMWQKLRSRMVQSPALQRISKILLFIEVLVCFAPMTLMLLLGVFIVPMQLHYLITLENNERIGPMLVLASVATGVAGMLALINVLLWLRNPSASFMDRRATLVCMTLGMLPISVYAFVALGSESMAERLPTLLPLACSAHLIYLARRFLFRASARTVSLPQ